MDQNKKTMRHFYCRDVLWETFEQMANDFDCSIDYLINESMRHYARAKNYQVAASEKGGALADDPNAQAINPPAPTPSQPPVRPRSMTPPPPPIASANQAALERRPTSNLPAMNTPLPSRPVPRQTPTTPMSAQTPQFGTSTPSGPQSKPSDSQNGRLYLIYENKKVLVDKDQFIIGRGSKSADLAIRDGNISRKHAAVIRRNGAYYIKDLGSTNGIDYKGMRIDNKRIDEGDVFLLCDYAIQFTYQQ